MRIALCISDLTCLRYIIPFSTLIKNALHSCELVYYFKAYGSIKYNAFATKKNIDTVVKLVKSYCDADVIAINSPMALSKLEATVLITVEDTFINEFNFSSRIISINHGFDYLTNTTKSQNVESYVCGVDYVTASASQLSINAITSPAPLSISCPSYDNIEPQSNKVTVLYPDVGNIIEANTIIKHLVKEKYDVVIKQRKKHQVIQTSLGSHVYDDIWFPSEAIFHPLSSSFVIGFGSSAYTDICESGARYINVDLSSTSKPFNTFKHPKQYTNYQHVLTLDEAIHACNDYIQSPVPLRHVIDYEQMYQFIVKLIHG